MLKLNRVVVPLSLDCNLHCKYCYRKAGLRDIPEFNNLMRNYLKGLQPSWCNSVTASGGEPLLHFDKVKELFSYVSPLVHKKIMTNYKTTLLALEKSYKLLNKKGYNAGYDTVRTNKCLNHTTYYNQ